MGAPVVKKSKVPVVLLDLFQQLEGGYWERGEDKDNLTIFSAVVTKVLHDAK